MRFFIDGCEWSFPHMDSLSRQELLDALREKEAAEDRLIVDMLCDGESLSESELFAAPEGIDVDIITKTPWELGKDLLEEIKNSLLKVFRAVQGALDAPGFDASGLEDAFRELDWIEEVCEGLADAYPEYEGTFPDASPLRGELDVLQNLLADGRYADANAWHEREWKKESLPPFAERMNAFRDWLEEMERREN